MTPEQHYRTAERLLQRHDRYVQEKNLSLIDSQVLLSAAQVHATLATAPDFNKKGVAES